MKRDPIYESSHVAIMTKEFLRIHCQTQEPVLEEGGSRVTLDQTDCSINREIRK